MEPTAPLAWLFAGHACRTTAQPLRCNKFGGSILLSIIMLTVLHQLLQFLLLPAHSTFKPSPSMPPPLWPLPPHLPLVRTA